MYQKRMRGAQQLGSWTRADQRPKNVDMQYNIDCVDVRAIVDRPGERRRSRSD